MRIGVANNWRMSLKPMAKKNVDAVYTHLVIEMPPAAASLLDRDVLLSAKVIRHLLVVSDDTQTESEEASAEK